MALDCELDLDLVGDNTISVVRSVGVVDAKRDREFASVELMSIDEGFVDIESGSTRVEESVNLKRSFCIWGLAKEGDVWKFEVGGIGERSNLMRLEEDVRSESLELSLKCRIASESICDTLYKLFGYRRFAWGRSLVR